MSPRTGGQGGRIIRDLDGQAVETQPRPCLRCRKPFDSVGPGNRLCPACRGKVAELSPYAV